MKICNFPWNSNCGKPGSNHYCALEDGHCGPHECRGAEGNCNEVLIERDAAPPVELPFHLQPFHLHRDVIAGDIEFEVPVKNSP